ncbi:hypothetical protein Unana1_08372 [Umbelopsis nana]
MRRLRLLNATAYNFKDNEHSYSQPSQMHYQPYDHISYNSPNPYNNMDGYQSAPYGSSTLTANNYTTNYATAQAGDAQTRYYENSSATTPIGSQMPYPMPPTVLNSRPMQANYYQPPVGNVDLLPNGPPVRTESNRTEASTTYSAPNTNESMSRLNPPQADSSGRHVPHQYEGISRSPPHTPHATNPQSPHSA